MDLQNNSQEYAHVVFSVLPSQTATVDASVDLKTWQAVNFVNNEGLVLLRGPNATQTQGLLVAEASPLWIRVTDSPEVIVRSAGMVNLY